MSGWVKRTRQAPQPGRWPCRAHGRYHHYHDAKVSITNLRHDPDSIRRIELAPSHGFDSSGLGARSVVCRQDFVVVLKNVPDRQNAASLGKVGLLLDAANPLLEDGRDLGWGGLLGVCAGLEGRDGGCGISLYGPVSLAERRARAKTQQLPPKLPMLAQRPCAAVKKLD